MFSGLRNYFRRLGHRHRAASRWAKAADAYGWHVRLHPHDIPDWIRLAECSLASGRSDKAARVYEYLRKLSPDKPDIAFQLAHILKITGRDTEALEMFQRALLLSERIDNNSVKIWPTPDTVAADTILYSVQDMINYLTRNSTVTGIQRVQAGIARHLIEAGGSGVGFVLTDAEYGVRPGDFWLLDPLKLLALIDAVESVDGDHASLKRLIVACRNSARPIRPGLGHTLIILGAFWALGNAPTRYLAAKKRGARVGVYIYDLIPITHPQFCEMELCLHFSVGFSQICALTDFFLTISEDTAERVRVLLSAHDRVLVPVQAVPLAHTLSRCPDLTPSVETDKLTLMTPFVAYVSTIEGRKNHIYVMRIWEALIARGVAVPDLWFVGRLGWKIGPLTDVLEQTKNLGGRVRLMHDLTDAELAQVYSRASFTVFTSFVEGWGLPIGESLAHGTPCVSSDTSSMPEVGGDLVDYVDPTDTEQGLALIGRLLNDPFELEERRRRIAEKFVARTWDDVGADFVKSIRCLSLNPTHPARPPLLEVDQSFRPGEMTDADFSFATLMRSPRGLLLAEFSGGLDDHGAWMGREDAVIRFQSPLPPGTPITLTLGFYRRGSPNVGEVSVTSGDHRVDFGLQSLPSIQSPPRLISLNGRVAIDGTVTLCLAIDKAALVEDSCRVGLCSIGYQPRIPQ
ncbi:MAG: hypothetical protein DCF28_03720 [Alphaproteobacteria bacterium]|nr:MAG: hypothetical protein DCF28_03720 [Alphaproteobacteria bacterium]PZO40261.1 MAG: hypothetical protein DCE92_02515 [Alphaproteobacteria bacterium]